MRDFLKGTLGVFLQIILVILGIGLLVTGLLSCGSSMIGGGLLLVLGILCLCAVGGIRYWLGHISELDRATGGSS
jgi:hypothetical protein